VTLSHTNIHMPYFQNYIPKILCRCTLCDSLYSGSRLMLVLARACRPVA